jgi:hypothetical protein
MKNSYYYETAMQLIENAKNDHYPFPRFVNRVTEKEDEASYESGGSIWDWFSELFGKKVKSEDLSKAVQEQMAQERAKHPEWYTKQVASYTGADTIVRWGEDNKPVGECKAIFFNRLVKNISPDKLVSYVDGEYINSHPVTLVLDFTVFDKQPEILTTAGPFDITLDYQNEYGSKSQQKIIGVELLFIEGGMSIDKISNEARAIFMANDITNLVKL